MQHTAIQVIQHATSKGRIGVFDQDVRERLQDLSKVYWHHTLRLLPDLIVEGGKTAEMLEAEREAILGIVDLAGRSVVDVGTWNGYFAFEAKRAGARQVIATDSYVWRSPLFRGRETFEIARECLDIAVEAREIDPTEFPGDIGSVDVVLFLGVFYHMADPILVLNKVASVANDLLVIETHEDLLNLRRPAMAFYPGTTLNNDGSNWWGPNPECMRELLAAVGFPCVFYQHHPQIAYRGIYHAFRSARTAELYLRRRADNVTLFDLGSDEAWQALSDFACLELGKVVTERDKALAEIAALRNAAEVLARAADAKLAKAIAERDGAGVERDAALAEIAALHKSTSWAATAPLRALSSIIRSRR